MAKNPGVNPSLFSGVAFFFKLKYNFIGFCLVQVALSVLQPSMRLMAVNQYPVNYTIKPKEVCCLINFGI